MSTFEFTNVANTTLEAGISPTTTSVTLALGTGAEFPPLSAGQIFAARLTDAATKTDVEVVYATAIAGDVVTVVRGQEGTTAQTWITGDIFFHGLTAGTMNAFVQAGEVVAPARAHKQSQSIGPSYSDELVIGATALSAGYFIITGYINLGAVAAANITLSLTNSYNSASGGDIVPLSQMQRIIVGVPAGQGIFGYLNVTTGSGSYPATLGSYGIDMFFVASSL